ncbi:elongator complex protein 3 [Anaerosinus sp.]
MKRYIIPVFIPHYGCTNECVFCNQHKITGSQTTVNEYHVRKIILDWLERLNYAAFIEVAFYGGSFTALSIEKQQELLSPAYEFLKQDKIQAIRISTRPDAIDDLILRNLILYGVSIIELGVQSLDNKVLKKSCRGHTKEDVELAVAVIRKYANFKLGLQVMPGLPKDTLLKGLLTIRNIIELKPDFVRIYPTVVLNHTKLAKLYCENQYTPLSLDESIKYCSILKILLDNHQIPIIRMGLQATENLNSANVLAGPYHPAFGELVQAEIFYLSITKFLEKINLYKKNFLKQEIIIFHSNRLTSKIRGNKNSNIKKWSRIFPYFNLKFSQEANEKNFIKIKCDNQIYTLNINLISNI